jgi:hypothetical protein
MPSEQEFRDMAEYYMADPVAPVIPGYGLNGYPDGVRRYLWEPFSCPFTPGMIVDGIVKANRTKESWHTTTEAYGFLCLFEAELVRDEHAG